MIDESTLTRLIKHSNEHECAILTAYRTTKTNAENHKSNEVLGYALQKLGYGVTKVLGTYEEQVAGIKSKEWSWFTVNKEDKSDFFNDVCRLAAAETQDTILFMPKDGLRKPKLTFLYGISPNDFCPPGKKIYAEEIKYGAKDNKLLTIVKHKPFYFMFQDNISESDLTIPFRSPLVMMELINKEIKRRYNIA